MTGRWRGFLLIIALLPAACKNNSPSATPSPNWLEREIIRFRTTPHRERARQLIAARRWRPALASLDNLLTIAPGDREAQKMALEIEARLARPAAVIARAALLIRLAPDDPTAYLYRAFAYRRQGHDGRARADFIRALARPGLGPDQQRTVRLALADLAIASHRFAEAAGWLAGIARPADPYHYFRRLGFARAGAGRIAGAVQAFERAARTARGEAARAEALKRAALLAQTMDDWAVADRVQQAALALRPGDRTLLLARAELARRHGRMALALGWWRRAFAVSPSLVLARRLAAGALAAKKPALAIAPLAWALARQPNDVALIDQMIAALRRRGGDPHQITGWLERRTTLAPTPRALFVLASAYQRQGDARAIARFKSVLATAPLGSPLRQRAHGALAMLYHSAGRYRAAAAEFIAAWRLSGKRQPIFLLHAAHSLAQAGPQQTAKAAALFARAANQPALAAPARTEARRAGASLLASLGDRFYAAGRFTGAIAAWRRAQNLKARPQVTLNIGYALIKTGERTAAAQTIAAVLAHPAGLAPGKRAPAYAQLGYLFDQLGQPQKTIAAWRASLALRHNAEIALRLAAVERRNDEWAHAWRHLQALTPPDDMRAFYYDELSRHARHRGDRPAAARALGRALALEETAARQFRLGLILGDGKDALAALRRAHALSPGTARYTAALGYSEYRAGALAAAARHLEEAANHEASPALFEDLGYLHRKLFHNRRAAYWFGRALDAEPASRPKTRARLHREIAQLKRRLEASLYSLIRSSAPRAGALTPAGRSIIQSQGGLEAAYSPPGIGFRDGRRLQIFSRLLWAYDGAGLSVNSRSLQAGAGLRYKPLRRQNLVLAAERLVAIGAFARNDWMLRASYSWDHTGDQAGRLAARFYIDGALVNPANPDLFLAGEGALGAVRRLAPGLTLIPHVLIAAAYSDDRAGTVSVIEGGAGLTLRRSFHSHKNRISAIDITLQGRGKLAGNSPDRPGLAVLVQARF